MNEWYSCLSEINIRMTDYRDQYELLYEEHPAIVVPVLQESRSVSSQQAPY